MRRILLLLLCCSHSSLLLFLSCYGRHRDLPSFPTRRSSDLYRGVSGGATVSNAFALAKLAPLVAFILAGLFFMLLRKGHIALLDAPSPSGAWLEALLVLVFAYGGFEAAMIPLGEARNPRRDAPFALFVALGTG